MAKERIHWVDVAKGILILLLIIHHFKPAFKLNEIPLDNYKFVTSWQFVFTSFFMQAFLFMSGYCSNFNKEVKPFVLSLFKQLILPFVFFEFLTCIYWSFDNGMSLNNLYYYWLNSNGTHYWFLNALILAKLYIFVIVNSKYLSNNVYLFLSSFCFLVISIVLNDLDFGTNFLCIRQSLGAVFFVVLGYIAKLKNDVFEKTLKLGGVFPCLLIVLAVLGHRPPAYTARIGVTMMTLIAFVFTSTSGILCFLWLCKHIGKQVFFEYFGRNSLIVYCVHFIPLTIILSSMYKYMEPQSIIQRGLFVSLAYIAEVILCSVLIEVFNKRPFKWIVGKF